ncbi:hypothetical protein ASL14_10835 [Paenibacillus sp. IHB B 3084]|uniref:hypothetical protein n=1 Tax=Paenibacillus sp. IHB B 3084 TaxID=867076 RepID=UPI0007212EDC|nr:hypothetical protein [Paenibacillus sp. IHB B 3084]ALP36583.1 hypothetical protein ASL14_10835 [Paenibacillus sp. IHB B 3084]
MRQLRKEREGIKRTLQQEEANGEKIQNELQQILRIVSMFSRYLENGWLKDVKYVPVFKRPPLLVLRDQRYSVLYRLYKDIHTDMKRNPSNRQSTYPFKRSSVLMEVYSTCLVIDVLKELEFDWDSGWLADHYQEQYVGELLTGERMIFRKDEYRLELIYDQEIPKRLNEDEFGFIANNHSRPDLRLDLYDTDGKLIKSLIIEVKYRKYRYLWNARLNRETDDFIQISDYNRILYRCPIERNRSNKIDKVITLYPKQTNGTAYEHKYDKTVTFIQVEPIDPNSDEVSFGYGYLKKEIGEFIEKNIMLSKRDTLAGSITVN